MPKRAAPVEETKQEAPKTPEKVKTPEKKEPSGPPGPGDARNMMATPATGTASRARRPGRCRGAEAEGRGGRRRRSRRSGPPGAGRRKPAPKTSSSRGTSAHSTFEHPEAATQDDLISRFGSEFPPPQDDMDVATEDDYP